MIRLFIAFGEWLKLNFNVLSGNFISLLSVDIEWHGRNESCWPKWPENINWPSGPIFVQFDWPDRKYTGHGHVDPCSRSWVFSEVRVIWSLVLCVMFCRSFFLSFCPFSFGHCVVCPLTYTDSDLPLWYLQTLLQETKNETLHCGPLVVNCSDTSWIW